jgi:predicted RNase H-like HicB family nuclease
MRIQILPATGPLDFIGQKLDISQMKITALIHDCSKDGETGFAATCVEFPEANGQGETEGECLEDLRQAVEAVLTFRREEALRSLGEGERLTALSA